MKFATVFVTNPTLDLLHEYKICIKLVKLTDNGTKQSTKHTILLRHIAQSNFLTKTPLRETVVRVILRLVPSILEEILDLYARVSNRFK